MDGTTVMAKKQRTIQLPEDIYKLADALESIGGARFNRQVLAAMLAYYYTNPRGPDHRWMEAAVEIERGELKLADVPIWVRLREIAEADAQCKEMREDQAIIDPKVSVHELEEYKEAYDRLGEAGDSYNEWYSVSELAKDAIDALVVFWKRLAAGVLDYEILHSTDRSKYREKADTAKKKTTATKTKKL